MSNADKYIKKIKNIVNCEKNNEIFDEEIIECNKDRKLIEAMINGYKEMANINLQLAIDNEGELLEFYDYETWLCGV